MSGAMPEHIYRNGGVVTVSGDWWTHEHPHSHSAGRLAFDGESINHTRSISHRHEHCWQPQERHHHAVEPVAHADPQEQP